MQREPNRFAVVILAGGEATRFPGKLESEIDGVPLLVRVYHNLRGIGPTYVSGTISEDLRRQLDCPVIPDRQEHRGPLGGLVSSFEVIAAERIFVVAGDAPLVDAAVFRKLADNWESDLEAVIAESQQQIEPLCALYDRGAFLTAAGLEFATGCGSVAKVAKRLRHKRILFENDGTLASINTPADRNAFLEGSPCA